MYTQKNGILYKDGKPRIMLGVSYYPSFHIHKYPTPPDGDRIGEMKADLAAMREFGLNQVRVAALGSLSLDEQGNVKCDTPFIDELIREAERNGITAAVRLQGYVTNLRGNDDFLMRNEKDEPMNGYWSAFITASLFHEGINRDTDEATTALARHFATFPNVLSLQTYNEPHYPYNGVFDYHPATLEAYAKWREARGLPVAEAPRSRPKPGESVTEWVRWRLFSMEAMGNFLNNAARLSVEASGLESFTCATSCAATPSIMNSGISYFDQGEGMDIVGITTYVHLEGADYHTACYVFDLAESAAATFGKHAWVVEADARTHMPGRKAEQNVYAMLGAGHKGINFYAWRGDCPVEGTPHADNCGIIHNDGTKSTHYDSSKRVIKFVNDHSELFAATEKHRDGLGILWSAHAFAAADAHIEKEFNRSLHDAVAAYREARGLGFCVDFARGCDLDKNPLGIKLLLVPYSLEMLSDEESEQLRAFAALPGHRVFCKRTQVTFSGYCVGGWWELDRPIANVVTLHFDANRELLDVADEVGLTPYAVCDNPRIHAAVLDGDGYKLVWLVNSATSRADISGASVKLAEPPRSARFLSPGDGSGEVSVDCEIIGDRVSLPTVAAGGVLVLEY